MPIDLGIATRREDVEILLLLLSRFGEMPGAAT